MAKTKAQKKEIRDNLEGLFGKANAAVMAEYRGVTANQLAELRVELHKAKASFKVVKNRLAIKAIEGGENANLAKSLKGPIGLAYMYGDVAQGTKALLAFEKNCELFKVTGGIMEGKVLSAADLRALSELPSKEVLIARMLGSLTSPHRGLLTVINGVGSKLVRVLAAIKDTKS